MIVSNVCYLRMTVRRHVTSYAETTLFRHVRSKGLTKYKHLPLADLGGRARRTPPPPPPMGPNSFAMSDFCSICVFSHKIGKESNGFCTHFFHKFYRKANAGKSLARNRPSGAMNVSCATSLAAHINFHVVCTFTVGFHNVRHGNIHDRNSISFSTLNISVIFKDLLEL